MGGGAGGLGSQEKNQTPWMGPFFSPTGGEGLGDECI